MTERFSDERLNAYLDGELELEECLAILRATESDAALRARLARLRATRALLQHAYRNPPPPPEAAARPRRRSRAIMAGTGLALAAGLALGWGVAEMARPAQLVEMARTVHGPIHAQETPLRVMLHVTTGDEHRFHVMLRETEQLLDAHDPDELEVEVVANGPGLQMLRAGSSPVEERIAELRRKHKNLLFLACQETLARVERDTGVPVTLVDGTATTTSAFAQAIKRQREGWMYLQI